MLVDAVSEITGDPAVYQGIPTSAYRIGRYIVSLNGILEGSCIDPDMMTELEKRGFEHSPVDGFDQTADPSSEESENKKYTVRIPRESLTDEAIRRLRKFVEIRDELFTKVFDTDRLEINIDNDTIAFPWFPEKNQLYDRFIMKLCIYVKNARQINNVKYKVTTNLKYRFRKVLIYLGYNGKAFKGDRKELLTNLPGRSDYRQSLREEGENQR